MDFHNKLAKILGIYGAYGKSKEELEKEIIEKLEYRFAIEETNKRIEDQTRGMNGYQKQQYFNSWSR